MVGKRQPIQAVRGLGLARRMPYGPSLLPLRIVVKQVAAIHCLCRSLEYIPFDLVRSKRLTAGQFPLGQSCKTPKV